MASRRWVVAVEFITKDDARGAPTAADISEYVAEAVATWQGQRSPDDPLMGNVRTVRVRRLREMKP